MGMLGQRKRGQATIVKGTEGLTLKTDEVDLVILNQAPAALNYQVFCKGKLEWL